MAQYPKTITYIAAPDVPSSEVAVIRKNYYKNENLATNYNIYVATVKLNKGERLLISAPGIPSGELKQLRKHFKEAVKNPAYVVVANYDMSASAIPKASAGA